jgi:hypothetical protein
MVRALPLILASIVVALTSLAQEPPTEAPKGQAVKEEAPVFFSGTVTQISPSSLTVNRKGTGSDIATKTFAMARETKVEGKLRLKVKVTVRFEVDDEGNAKAVHIIVR